jgi:ADP-ribose pyrophosphatase
VPESRAKTLSSKVMFSGSVFSVRRDQVREPGGVEATRDIVVHNGSVVLLPVFPGGKILMVRQYRYAASDFLWELVAGRIDPGESTVEGARRELAEETGYTAGSLRQLMELFPSPGFVSERMWIFLATDLKKGKATPEEDERITAGIFSLPALKKMIQSGKLRDSKSVCGILYYSQFLQRGK